MENVTMLPAEPALRATPDINYALDLLEFEMALDSVQPAANGFCECVSQAASSLDGAFLFDLPASGLVEKCQKIAAVHLPLAGQRRVVFVFLNDDGTGVRVEMPTAATTDLARFAEAFVALHERL